MNNTKLVRTPKFEVEIELKEWITGSESEEIVAPIKDIRFKINTQGQGDAEMNMGEAMKASIEKAISIVVLKVGNSDEDLLEQIRQMPRVDYDFILKEIDGIVKGEDFEKPVSEKNAGTD